MIYYRDIEGFRFYVKDWEYDPILTQVIVTEHTHDEREAYDINISLVKALLCEIGYRNYTEEYKKSYVKTLDR